MDSKQILADFQLAGNRVSKFTIESKDIDANSAKVNLNHDIDYNVIEIIEDENRFIGLLNLVVEIKAKLRNAILFKISLTMEGLFLGNPEKIDKEQFANILELNGITTLSHLSRSYILSVTALSGINPPVKLPMINVHSLKLLKHKKDRKNENEEE